jgi:hypothetical protein
MQWQMVTGWELAPGLIIPPGATLTGTTNPDGSITVSWEGYRVDAYGLSHAGGQLGPPIVVPTPIPLGIMPMDQEAAAQSVQWWPDFLWADFHFGPDVDVGAAKAQTASQPTTIINEALSSPPVAALKAEKPRSTRRHR